MLQNLLGGLMNAPIRKDADGALVTDGSETKLLVNEDGRLKVATKPGSFQANSGTLTTTAVAASGVVGDGSVAGTGFIAVDVSNASNVVFHMKNVGTVTMAAGQFAIEASLDSTTGSDGTWFAIQAIRSDANTILTNTGTLTPAASAGLTWSYESSVNAYTWFRIRVTTNVTTNAAAKWTVIRGSYATEPIPGAQASATQPVSGTVTVTLPTPTAYAQVTTASTNAAVVKASAGTMYEITLSNPTATAVYVKVFNLAVAPTVGTSVPLVTFPVPANTTVALQFGATGKRFGTGISICATAAIGATDTANAVAGVQISASYI